MSWSKLKNIMILILLLLNLFLLGLVGANQLRASRYQAKAISEAAAVLERNGIRVDRDGLSAAMDLSAATAVRDGAREAALAAALLGAAAERHEAGGGLSIYSADSGSASFRSGGEFLVTFSEPLPVPGDRTGWVRDLLERQGLDLWRVSESGETVTAVQQVNGAPVFSAGQAASGAVFRFDEAGQLTEVGGRLLLGRAAAESESQKLVTAPTALIAVSNFIIDNGDVCQSIQSMAPAYRAAPADPVRLTPMWRISTDAGDYFLDAYTAEVTRAAEGGRISPERALRCWLFSFRRIGAGAHSVRP